MNKRGWIIPVLIVALNALVIFVKWSSLPEVLPAHFDLQGNASGTMQRYMLLVYPMIGALICLFAYLFARVKHLFHNALIILTSGIGLILLSSSLVTLSSGTMPVFMLAEPVILLATIAGVVVSIVKSRRNAR